MSAGSLMLSNEGQPYECGHEHSVGDRCVCFQYTSEFFERAGIEAGFPIPRIPAVATLTPYLAEAQLGVHAPKRVNFEELAHGLMSAAWAVLKTKRRANRTPTAADERRISAVLRSIEATLDEPLRLEHLAATVKMSEFHFLRVFRQVTGITPHKYILRARLRDAALRLKIDSSRILDVALNAGFQDVSNFHHAFRAEFGVGPARFRGNTVSAILE
jgi:AraC-like DNA-binding protein